MTIWLGVQYDRPDIPLLTRYLRRLMARVDAVMQMVEFRHLN